MTGREETDAKYKGKTMRMLQNRPQIIKDFFYSFGNRTEMTRFHYIRNVLEFVDYLKTENKKEFNIEIANKILPIDIEKYMNWLKETNKKGNADNSLAVKFSSLKYFFTYLGKNRYIEFNPCEDAVHPKQKDKNEIIFMTEEEIKKVCEGIENGISTKSKKFVKRDLLLFRLGCTTGLRASSLLEINIEDIDFENKKINIITKGCVTRECCLSDSIISLMKQWIAEREKITKANVNALFTSSVGKRMSYQALYKLIQKHTKILGKKISPHKMRSSCATNLYAITNDIYRVQKLLGHKQIENTKRYAKIGDKKIQESVELLDSIFD